MPSRLIIIVLATAPDNATANHDEATAFIGLLYHQSGALAEIERPLLQAALLAIDELNQRGGVRGRRIEPLLTDRAFSGTSWLEQIRHLLHQHPGASLFGGSNSVRRRSCLPLLQQYNGLLWYPMAHEGLESSRYILYGGACPNQQLLPALKWLLQQVGNQVYLIGTDNRRSHTLHALIHAAIANSNATAPTQDSGESRPSPPSIRGERFLAPSVLSGTRLSGPHLSGTSPVPKPSPGRGSTDFSSCWQELSRLRPSVIISTLEREQQQAFMRQYAEVQGGKTAPIFTLDLTEQEIQQLGSAAVGHYTITSYLSTLAIANNQTFIEKFQARYGIDAPLCDAAQTTYSQIHLWKQAAEAAQSFEADDIRRAALGMAFASPGGLLRLADNHHVSRHCHIAQVDSNQTLQPVHDSGPIEPFPWLGAESSPYSSLLAEQLLQTVSQHQVQARLNQKKETQQQRIDVLQAEIIERHRSEQEVRLRLAIRQAVERATTARDALIGAIQCISQETGWPYGELWLPNEEQLQRSTIWYLDEPSLNPSQIQSFYQLRYDKDARVQRIRGRFLEKVWYTEKVHWTRALQGERVIGIPIFELKAAGAWDEIIDQNSGDDSDDSITLFQSIGPGVKRQILGILLFALPQERPQDKQLVTMVSNVVAQLGSIVQQKKSEAALRHKNQELALALHQLKETQSELNQSEKMAALGHFAAGIAHELNTPLGAIGASVDAITQFIAEEVEQMAVDLLSRPTVEQEILGQLIQITLENRHYCSHRERRQHQRNILPVLIAANIPDPKVMAEMLVNLKAHDKLNQLLPLLTNPSILLFLQQLNRLVDLCQGTQDISLAVERASKVTIALTTYTQSEGNAKPLEATNIIGDLERVLDLYQNRLGREITVVRQFISSPPLLLCHPEKLNQVWIQIIYNAIQALEDAKSKDSNQEQLLTLEVYCPRQEFIVKITDTGIGIPAAIQSKIFDPFLTTRPPGEGSGLGLTIAEKIIREHNGTIAVESVPGQTTFTVQLPLDGCSGE